jgi:hypothetical protein
MFPSNAISAFPVSALLLSPDIQRTSDIEDFEMGGVDILDASQGMNLYRWRCWTDNTGAIYLQRDGGPVINYMTVAGANELAFAFDQNMRPALAFRMGSNRIDLRWYDSSVGQYVMSTGLTTGRNPRLSLDDKRASQTQNSDIILAYLRGTSLHYRIQRDRYLVEYTAASNLLPTTKLRNIGMATNYRFLFDLA